MTDMNDMNVSDSLKFAQITVNFDILNFRDLGSSIIPQVYPENHLETSLKTKWHWHCNFREVRSLINYLCGFPLNGYLNVCTFLISFSSFV